MHRFESSQTIPKRLDPAIKPPPFATPITNHNELLRKIAIFEGSLPFPNHRRTIPIILGIHVSFRGCKKRLLTCICHHPETLNTSLHLCFSSMTTSVVRCSVPEHTEPYFSRRGRILASLVILLMEEILHQLIDIPLFTGFHSCLVVQDF